MYTRIGIAGSSGALGRLVTEALMNTRKFEIYIIDTQQFEPKEKEVLKQDWSKQRNVKRINMKTSEGSERFLEELRNVEVVLSFVGNAALESVQYPLIDACKKAGIKLFIPSEYGLDLEYLPEIAKNAIFQAKLRVREYMKKAGIPYIIILTGFFSDFFLQPHFGIDLNNLKIRQYGDLDKRIAFIHRRDIAHYLSKFFQEPDDVISTFIMKQMYLFTEFLTQSNLAGLLKEKYPNLSVEHVPLHEAMSIVENDKYGLNSFGIQVLVYVSKGLMDHPIDGYKILEAPHAAQILPLPITMKQVIQSL